MKKAEIPSKNSGKPSDKPKGGTPNTQTFSSDNPVSVSTECEQWLKALERQLKFTVNKKLFKVIAEHDLLIPNSKCTMFFVITVHYTIY